MVNKWFYFLLYDKSELGKEDFRKTHKMSNALCSVKKTVMTTPDSHIYICNVYIIYFLYVKGSKNGFVC